MTGYQEVMTDPSYAGQIVNFTFPHVGNVGTNLEDVEADAPHAFGRSEEHTSELQSLMRISYAVFCLKKKTKYKVDTMRSNVNTKKLDERQKSRQHRTKHIISLEVTTIT